MKPSGAGCALIVARGLSSVHRECHDQPITVAVVYGAEWLVVRDAPA
jgi:hypothetical protein